MTKAAVAVTLISALLFSAMAAAQLSPSAEANIMIGIVKPSISIASPTNTTYSANALSLRARFETIATGLYDGGPRYEQTRLFTYAVDGRNQNNITIIKFDVGDNPGASVFFEGVAFLEDLTEGPHNLTVRVVFNYSSYIPSDPSLFYAESASTVCFRIDTVPQNISILSPENTSYMFGVPLQFSADEPPSWIGYSLDGQENVTIAGNMTLHEVSAGQHTLTLYANDAAGNPKASETITFSVADPLPMGVVAFSVAVLAGAGSPIYFGRRKRQASGLGRNE